GRDAKWSATGDPTDRRVVRVARSRRLACGDGRLTNQKEKAPLGSVFGQATYTYDNADRLTSQTLNGTLTSFSYDDTDQLTGATGGSAETYTYDLNGNRTMTGYATGTGNRMTSDGTWTYTYDDEGNLVKKSKGASAETWTYGYDHNNQMVW